MLDTVEYFNNLVPGSDLNLLFAGRQACPPLKQCGGSRTHFLLHYVLEGAGTVASPGDEGRITPIRLKKGDAFCYFPEQPLHYGADRDDPWEYTWVGFNARRAESIVRRCGFSPENPVLQAPPSFPLGSLFDALLSILCRREPGFDLASDGLLMQILGTLTGLTGPDTGAPSSPAAVWVASMKLFMDTNFQNPSPWPP